MNIVSQLKSEKTIILSDQVVVSGSSFITNLFLARALGAQHYGIFALAGLIQLFFLSISMSFFSQIFQVTFPNLKGEKKRIYITSILVIKAAAMSIFLIIGLVIYFITKIYFSQFSILALCIAITTPLFLTQDFLRRILLTSQLFKQALFADMITNFFQMGVLLFLWQFNLLTIETALYAVGLTFIPSIIYVVKITSWQKISFINIKQTWFIHQRKCLWLTLSALLQWSSGYFFIVIAGWWIGGAAMGALRLAQYIFGLLNILFQAIENYALPKAVIVKDKWKFLKQMLFNMLLLIVPLLTLLALSAKQIFKFAGGSSYQGFEYVIYGLCLVYLIIAISYPIRIVLRSMELNKEYFLGYLLSAAFSICFAFLLLQRFQLMGVICGLIITQIISNSFWVYTLKKKIILR